MTVAAVESIFIYFILLLLQEHLGPRLGPCHEQLRRNPGRHPGGDRGHRRRHPGINHQHRLSLLDQFRFEVDAWLEETWLAVV